MIFSGWSASAHTPTREQRFNLIILYIPRALLIIGHVVAISGCLWNESINELIAVIGRTGLLLTWEGQLLSMGCGVRGLWEISLSQIIFPVDILEKSLLSDLGFLICEMKGWAPQPLALVPVL